MAKDVMNGKGLSKCDVFKPKVDETPVPCPGGYHGTDCVYVSSKVEYDKLGLDPMSPLTVLLNKLICRSEEQEKMIDKLNRKIKRLEDGY